MDEPRERIARALCARYVGAEHPWESAAKPDREMVLADADAVIEALGIDVRHWVQHDGTRKRYYAITWTGGES